MKDFSRNRLCLCSSECRKKKLSTKVSISCFQCGKKATKQQCIIKKFKHQFCSSSCSATYNNLNKNLGLSKRSKLEKWLESKLRTIYPFLEFEYNSRKILNGLELDIYIPKYKLGFELNGIFHYEPVFGQPYLDKIKNRDMGKFQSCIEKGISLCVIDSTSMKYFKEDKSEEFLTIIKNIIDSKLAEDRGTDPQSN